MTFLSKRYCSHCGTPNPRENVKCVKCGKPISSALRASVEDDDLEEGVVAVKKKRPAKATRIIYEDEDSFDGDIIQPNVSDVVIERPQKITVASLKNGAPLPNFGANEALPPDIEVTSRSYFHKEDLG